MDLHDVASLVSSASSGAPLRFRKGTVSSVAADGSLTVTIAGSTTAVSGVKALASVCPDPGAGVWLATDGLDLFAIGTVTPVGPAHVSVQRGSDQTITTGTDTTIDFLSGATVNADTHGMFATGSSDRLTVQVPGVYLLTAGIAWAFDATGRRDVRLLAAGSTRAASYEMATPNTRGNRHSLATVVVLAAADIIQLSVTQSSGGNLAVSATSDSPRLTATWLRPVTS